MESVCKYLILQVDFASSNATCKNFTSWNCRFEIVLQLISSLSYNDSFPLPISQVAKLLDGWFLWWFSSLYPLLALAKGYEAPKLSFFMNLGFNLLCHELYKDLRHSWIALVIKKLWKTPKHNTIWLEMITRVLNMPIELKCNNYYSKVFIRVNYKL